MTLTSTAAIALMQSSKRFNMLGCGTFTAIPSLAALGSDQ